MNNYRCSLCMLGGWMTLVFSILSVTNAFQEYSTTYDENYPQNQIEDSSRHQVLSLNKLLAMASKGSSQQRYPPSVLGRGSGEVDDEERSLSKLYSAMYSEKNYPILRKLYPELLREDKVKVSGNKRLDAASFFGVRGKRPRRRNDDESEMIDEDLDSFYPDNIKRSELSISMKRQPPPGFHALRG